MEKRIELLDEVVVKGLEKLKTLTPGTKEYKEACEDITKLYSMEYDEIYKDCSYTLQKSKQEAEAAVREKELEFKNRQLEEDLSHREKELELRERELNIRESELESRNLQASNEDDFKHDELKFRKDSAEQQSKDEAKRNKIESVMKGVDIGCKILCTLITLRFYGNWMKVGLEFEKEGTFTYKTFMGLFQKFKPTKVD